MTVSANYVAHFPANALGGTASGSVPIDFLSDTIKGALLDNTFTFAQTTNEWFSDVSAKQITGTGYTAGGAPLTSKTVTVASLVTTTDSADIVWTSSTLTARFLCLYKDTGTGTTSPIIGIVNFGADVISSSGTFTVTVDVAGLGTVTVA